MKKMKKISIVICMFATLMLNLPAGLGNYAMAANPVPLEQGIENVQFIVTGIEMINETDGYVTMEYDDGEYIYEYKTQEAIDVTNIDLNDVFDGEFDPENEFIVWVVFGVVFIAAMLISKKAH
jgi:hypothetical protein